MTLADREQAADGVELVGQGATSLLDRGVGQRIAGEALADMLADGLGDLRRFPGGGGVVAAHDALTLVNSMTALVTRSALHRRAARFASAASAALKLRVGGKRVQASFLQALGLLAHRAQGLLEHHLVELLDVGLQRVLEVLLVEELRVVETGTHDALVTVDDGGGAFGVAVGDDDELVGQLAAAS